MDGTCIVGTLLYVVSGARKDMETREALLRYADAEQCGAVCENQNWLQTSESGPISSE